MKSVSKKECDCLVVGAGASGVCAAIACARSGAKTILIEKNNSCGGTAIIGMHSFICGLYLNGRDIPKNTLNLGLVREVCSLLRTLDPGKNVVSMGKVFVLPFSAKHFISALKLLINKTKSLKIYYNSKLKDVKVSLGEIVKVGVSGLQGTYSVFPRVIIDCSGRGEVIRLSKAGYVNSLVNKRQLAGFAFRVKGLKKADDSLAIKVPYLLTQAVAQKKMPSYLKFTKFSFQESSNEGLCRLNIPLGKSGLELSIARKVAKRAHAYLSKNLGSFKGSRIIDQSCEIIERQGLQGIGDYILTEDDIIRAKKFKDAAVKNSWPIEFWSQKNGPRYKYLRPGAYYEIPLRCLKSKNIDNLFFAGRCISVSPQALASSRVMGTCISLGEQAGLSAARYLKGK